MRQLDPAPSSHERSVIIGATVSNYIEYGVASACCDKGGAEKHY